MAVMYPSNLLDADVKSKAERRVFDALRDQLTDEWSVFHSASLVLRDHAEGVLDDECDFVLCHAEHGVVCLEVKGGGIECRHGTWYRPPDPSPIRDPFQQAIDHKHNVRRKLEEARGSSHPKLHVAHALAFPDITVHELVLAPDGPPELIWDRHALKDLGTALERTLAYHRGSRDKRVAPDPTLVRQVLAPDVAIQVPMAQEFLDEEEALVLLTHEQAGLVQRHWRVQRMAVHGCAGSGKTMIAVERAKRLAGRGRDVLFVCFNKQLAHHLRTREKVKGVTFTHFHSLCVRLASQAEVKLPSYQGEPPPAFFADELPTALMLACDKVGGQFDDLIVDEAQDLTNDWLDALMRTLREPESASVWLFLDDNQRIYEANLSVPPEFNHYDLTVNCRNTRAIHEAVMSYYEGDIEFDVAGPAGRPIVRFGSSDVPAAVATAIEFLVDREEVLPQDIVVLSSHALEKSEVGQAGAGRFRFSPKRGEHGDVVHFSSIRSFKGLESPVVVLCETEDLDPATRDGQLYVAISRARNHCLILERE